MPSSPPPPPPGTTCFQSSLAGQGITCVLTIVYIPEQYEFLSHTEPKIQNIYSQKWICSSSFPISTFMYLGAIFWISTIGLIWNLYFPLLCERTLGSTAGAEKRAGNCRQAGVGCSSLPSPSTPAVEPRVHINDQHKNFQFGNYGCNTRKSLIN
jgi:hypothetical protein